LESEIWFDLIVFGSRFDAQTWRVMMRMETMTKKKMNILARLVIPCAMQGIVAKVLAGMGSQSK
jgi:hypothetical protein